MIWVTWRQHRLQAATAAAVLAILAIGLVITEQQMISYLRDTGLATCLANHGSCDSLTQLFENRYGTLLNDIAYVNLLPLLVGMFWGAPLLAREYEQGTHLLAWTQTVSRRRWLTVKLIAHTAAAVLAAAVFSLLLTWWFRPFSHLSVHGGQSRIQPNVFDVQGFAPIGYTVFALALGTTAGALIRRTVPAMAVTVGGFLLTRIGIQILRGHIFTPLRSVHPLVTPNGSFSLGGPLVGQQNWVLSSTITDSSGHAFSAQTVLQTCQQHSFNPSQVAACISAHGYKQLDIYQPLSRYWPLQGIEFAIYSALAVALFLLTAWSITPRRHHRRVGTPTAEPSSPLTLLTQPAPARSAFLN